MYLKNSFNIFLFVTGCKNVYHCGDNICGMLAAIPGVLYFCVSLSSFRRKQLCTTCIFRLLLARHVQLYGQSNYILLDE